MKSAAQKSKKTKENTELKDTLCDIIKTLDGLSESTDKKLEELANYCNGDRKCQTQNQ